MAVGCIILLSQGCGTRNIGMIENYFTKPNIYSLHIPIYHNQETEWLELFFSPNDTSSPQVKKLFIFSQETTYLISENNRFSNSIRAV